MADTQAVKNPDGTYKIPETWTGLNDERKAWYQKYGTLSDYRSYKNDGSYEIKDLSSKYTYPTATPTTPTTPTTPAPAPDVGSIELSQVVPGKTAGDSQMNVQDYTGQLVHDPQAGFSNEMLLSNSTPQITDAQVAQGNVGDQAGLDPTAYSNQASTVDQTATAATVDPREAVGYDAATTADQTAQNDMQGAQGTVSNESQVSIDEIDTEAMANGETAVGQAIDAAAILDLNDVDARATLKGQIDILQGEFTNSNGDTVIPPWASGVARQVSKIAAFKGISGTAATEAMSNAIMEASINIAQQDAKFYQTVTLTNLNNRQQSTIHKAGILAQMELANLDARTTAAVENAKNFMTMDLANLDNDQQARIINTQQRFQSILEDSRAVNASRLFGAESANDTAKFYDTLNSQLSQFNASQMNAMSQFNAGETNAMEQFNSELSNARDLFYRTMAYNVDLSNAEWRRNVTNTNNQNTFDAAAFDAKNMVDVSQEALNQIWDRSDALLDYIWKSAENQMDRDSALAIAKVQAKASNKNATIAANAGEPGFADILGNIAGALVGSWFG